MIGCGLMVRRDISLRVGGRGEERGRGPINAPRGQGQRTQGAGVYTSPYVRALMKLGRIRKADQPT